MSAKPSRDPTSQSSSALGDGESSSAGVLDSHALQALKQLDQQAPGKVGALAQLFLTDTRSRLDALRLASGDVEHLARTAHNLKGSCATFAAATMVDLCEQLQEAFAAEDFRRVEVTLVRLDEEYQRVAVALGQAFSLTEK